MNFMNYKLVLTQLITFVIQTFSQSLQFIYTNANIAGNIALTTSATSLQDCATHVFTVTNATGFSFNTNNQTCSIYNQLYGIVSNPPQTVGYILANDYDYATQGCPSEYEIWRRFINFLYGDNLCPPGFSIDTNNPANCVKSGMTQADCNSYIDPNNYNGPWVSYYDDRNGLSNCYVVNKTGASIILNAICPDSSWKKMPELIGRVNTNVACYKIYPLSTTDQNVNFIINNGCRNFSSTSGVINVNFAQAYWAYYNLGCTQYNYCATAYFLPSGQNATSISNWSTYVWNLNATASYQYTHSSSWDWVEQAPWAPWAPNQPAEVGSQGTSPVEVAVLTAKGIVAEPATSMQAIICAQCSDGYSSC